MVENKAKTDLRVGAVLVGLVVVAALVRILIAVCDEPTLVTKTLSDDAFYYFQVARNAASGRGITFDGVEPTNGFHPLWFILLVPIHLLLGNSLTAPLHAALMLEAVLDAGAGVLIYSLVKALTQNRSAAILGAGIYLLNPSVIFHSVNGLETGLNLFCFVLYFWFYLRMLNGDKFSAGNILMLGFLSGVLMLARTDNIIVVGVTYAHLLLFRKMFRRLGVVAVSLALCAVVVAPWIIWNLVRFGTIVQSSGSSYSIITRGNLRAGGVTDFQIFLTSLSNTIKLLIWTIPVDVFGWGKLLGILTGLAVGMLHVDEDRTRQAWAAARIACIPLFAFLALALAHSLIRGTLKSWYFMPGATVGALFFGIFCSPYTFSDLVSSARARIVSCFLAVVILSGYALNGWTSWTKGLYPWQSEQLMAAEWLREHVDDTVWIGSFNAGIIGYMSERKVVNLDGLVNNSVVPYLQERRLWDYIQKRNISYLVDSDYSILKDYRDFYGPDWRANKHILRVAKIDDPRVSWAGTNVGVYRIIP